MCSGKSTVGRLLSSKLGWSFKDVDEEVERLEKMTISQIFEEKGEDYFRNVELKVLERLCEEEYVVISTGGGLGANLHALDLMKSKGLVVWLKVDFETFLERCGKDTSRPLLRRSREDLLKLFKERGERYACAHITLDALLKPEELAERIIQFCKGLQDDL